MTVLGKVLIALICVSIFAIIVTACFAVTYSRASRLEKELKLLIKTTKKISSEVIED